MLTDFLDLVATLPPLKLVRMSSTAYALVSALHIGSFAVMLGAILVADVSLLSRKPVIGMARRLAAFGCGTALLSGGILFLLRGAHYLANPAFRVKAVLILLALTNVVIAHRARTETRRRITALVSILLWAGVLLSGRFIAFV